MVSKVKRATAFGLLVFYSYMLLKVYTPVLSYWVNHQYIIENYCIYNDILKEKCDGRCYMHHSAKALHEQESSQQKQGNVPAGSYAVDVCLHMPSENGGIFSFALQGTELQQPVVPTYQSFIAERSTPPPQA